MRESSSLRDVVETLQAALEKRSPDDELFTSPLVGRAPLELMPVIPQAVKTLAHSKLHSYYPFSEVPRCWRRCYEEACLWVILHLLRRGPIESLSPHLEDEIIKLCDDAIIMTGAPGRRHLIDVVLHAIDHNADLDVLKALFPIESEEIASLDLCTEDTDSGPSVVTEESGNERPFKKPRLEHANGNITMSDIDAADLPSAFPIKGCLALENYKSTHPVSRIERPNLNAFGKMLSSPKPTPAVITGCLGHWPASTRWGDPRYWMYRTHRGRRRVPVEWGKSYVDSGWGQSIIPFGQFLREELLEQRSDDNEDVTTTKHASNRSSRRTGYLAQHDLLSQIPALRNDIAVPDYCYCSADESGDDASDFDSVEPLLNIWLGPADTVSPAHTDPHHNLLAQAMGRKYVRLFSPEQTPYMYPMGHSKGGEADLNGQKGYSMANTSLVDVGLEVDQFPQPFREYGDAEEHSSRLTDSLNLQRQKFPEFHSKAQFVECVLEPGEMLFIPRGWWHYIRSLEVSCNVSFWWD